MSEAVVDSKKEAAELIAALVIVALSVKAVLKDGKVDLADIPVLLDLIKKQEALVAGAAGVSDIKVRDLDIPLLIIDVVRAVQEVRAA